jgi:hypothetical protein
MSLWALRALALPRLASACAFCFGQGDGSQKGLVRGFTIAFIVLIACVMGMLAGIGATMITVERRRQAKAGKTA